MRRTADKWTTICHLQMIAQNAGRYAPRTTVLKVGEEIPPGTVLKRSHSECGDHVVLPSAKPRYRTWEYLNAVTSEGTFWMAQEYVESLEAIGEWRVLIVGGRIIAVMHTYKATNGKWGGTPTEAFLTLDEVLCVPFLIHTLCPVTDDIHQSNRGTVPDASRRRSTSIPNC